MEQKPRGKRPLGPKSRREDIVKNVEERIAKKEQWIEMNRGVGVRRDGLKRSF